MKPCALITRPIPEATELADFMAELGYTSMIEPMFSLKPIPSRAAVLASLPKKDIQALVFTSRNAVLSVKHLPQLFTIPALCVADTTAAFAKEVGFTRVTSANGNVIKLETIIRRFCAPERGMLIYVTGPQVAGYLQENLIESGFEMARHIIYDTKPIPALSLPVQDALRNRKIDIALFYSGQTARIFEQLVLNDQLKHYTSNITLFCLSRAVAGAFSYLKWADIHCPDMPNTQSLLELIRKFQLNLLSNG